MVQRNDLKSASRALPAYAKQLSAFHAAFAAELMVAVAQTPLAPGMRVLDVGCGDGFYTRLLARSIGPHGKVVGFDILPAYLQFAEHETPKGPATGAIEFVAGSLAKLPFKPESFDAVWCAQSLFSLPDPVPALRAMSAALRPGGFVAVLENDTLHQLLLPWPAELELAIRAAECVALHDTSRRPAKFYIGRRLPAVLASAGLECALLRTQAIDRRAPLTSAERCFVELYLQDMVDRVRPYLDATTRQQFDDLTRRDSEQWLLHQPQFSFTWLNMLAIGRKNSPKIKIPNRQ